MATRPFAISQSAVREKLRRNERVARNNNALVLPPLLAPSAWVGATAYRTGQVVLNSGNWFICIQDGTSAASGGPTTTTSGTAIIDGAGTLRWQFFGSPECAANDALAPTVTVTGTNPGGTYPNTYVPVENPNSYRVLGGYAATYNSLFWSIKTFNENAGSAIGSPSSKVSYKTDAPIFVIYVPANSQNFAITIDDRRLYAGGINTGGSDAWIIVDYSTVGGRKWRTVTHHFGKSAALFGGIRIKASDQVIAAPINDNIRVVVLADSYESGSLYGPYGIGSLWGRVGLRLGWGDIWSFARGSTGYINTGTGSGSPFYTYRQRIPEALTRIPDLWVLFGTVNDMAQAPSAITAAVLATLQDIRAGSQAPIVVVGLPSINDGNISQAEAAVAAAVTAFNDTNTYFIPIYAASPLPWVTGAWNNSAHSQSVNSAFMISDDGTHPPEIGTSMYSQRIADAIRDTLLA